MSLSVHVRPSVVNVGGKRALVCRHQLCRGEGGMDLSLRTVILPICKTAALEGFSLKITKIAFMEQKLVSRELHSVGLQKQEGISRMWVGASSACSWTNLGGGSGRGEGIELREVN